MHSVDKREIAPAGAREIRGSNLVFPFVPLRFSFLREVRRFAPRVEVPSFVFQGRGFCGGVELGESTNFNWPNMERDHT